MVYFFAFIFAFIISLLFTPLAKKAALYFKIVDYPAVRKIHQTPTPLLGGLAIFLTFSLATLFFWQAGKISDPKITDLNILAILISGVILIIGGIIDDILNLKPHWQFIFPVLAVVLVLLSGIKVLYVTNPLGGILKFSVSWGIILAFFWLLGMIYTTKLLDGLDGLVAGITVIGSIIIFIVSLYWDVPNSGTSILALILAGSCLGFLLFNWHPAKIFLGEGGSVLCGFLLGVLSIISGSKIATALLVMGIPVLDVIWVILRRLAQKKSLVKGDNRHLHFRLLDIGLSHRQAVLLLYLVSLSFGLTSLFLPSSGKIIALGILALLMAILAISLVLIYQNKNR
ncbi:MAG TPA: MraY family glycosyltransferase [Patescibacteria group bacterium]|nr:MraY family glycosyltransferase [Patescibacteria group bacterium]